MERYQKISYLKEFCLPIEIKKDGRYFLAFCPKWSGCYAQGKTIDEATAELISVASSLIELYEEEGLKIPLKKLEEKPAHKLAKISFKIPVFTAA